jgi:hypothetical protein
MLSAVEDRKEQSNEYPEVKPGERDQVVDGQRFDLIIRWMGHLNPL